MSPTQLQRLESGIRVVLDFIAAFNKHDVEAMLKRLSKDCVFENAIPIAGGNLCAGSVAAERFLRDFFEQAPDARMEIEEIFGLGFRCVTRWRCEWTDASGVKQRVRGVDIYKVKTDLICEKLAYLKS
jgi:limonene-1,2-epoxide hydrolase